MIKTRKYIRLLIVILLPLVFIFSECLHQSKPSGPRGPLYTGSAACLKCHREVAGNYFHSAHYLTSRSAIAGDIGGSFSPGSNTIIFNDSVKLVMEKRKDGIYQAEYINGKIKQVHRFDITFGRNRGESFFYWKGNKAYQLPATYYISLHQWGNSPGYSGDSVNFSRVIGRRCFECHSSYIQNLPGYTGDDSTDVYDKSSLILGIDCERCHGPGAAHVDFQTQNPTVKQARYITKMSALTRQQRIDLCSLCHSGNNSIMLKSTFGFKPGDTLSDFTSGSPFHAYRDAAKVDVHGNQVKLLTSSKCFMASKIECATCHSIHDSAIKTVKTYSQYCAGCHSAAKHNFCKMASQVGPAINSNCIDCHMPMQTSHSIVINGPGGQLSPPFLARTHLIAIYPDESKRILAMLNAQKQGQKQ